jgi:predicted O-methyltransferase YrrM
MDLAAYLAARDRSADANEAMPVVVKGATRADLAAYFAARGFRRGAEVGVFQGEHAEALCRAVPGLKLICVDRWEPYPVERAPGYTRRPAPGKHMLIYRKSHEAREIALARLAPHNCKILRAESLEAAARVKDASLDFVYLDADHRLEAIAADLEAWVPKVRRGGVVAGHDYEDHAATPFNGVGQALKDYTRARGVLGRVKVRPGEPHERNRSWFWDVPA